MKNKIPEDLIAKANALSTTVRFTGDTFEVVEGAAGEKCSNGGEYGFASVFKKTAVPGIYFWERTCTCDFDGCGTGPQGYVVLTKEKVFRMLEEEKRITSAAKVAWDRYQWGSGEYPRYTGYSCEAEIAAILNEG